MKSTNLLYKAFFFGSSLKAFKQVSNILFGKGSLGSLNDYIGQLRLEGNRVYLLDHAHKSTGLQDKLEIGPQDRVLFVDTTDEPTTDQVDELVSSLQNDSQSYGLIIGIGGGCTMDVAKAVSVMMKNEGSSQLYQGWNLVKNPGLPKLAVPTISGTGAEASRTAVLKGPDKKFGINSEYSMYDAIVMDPDLLKTVPNDQRFFTGMDCYIHCVESLEGSFINAMGKGNATQAHDICVDYFMKGIEKDDELMSASFFGGNSVANSEVGVCHALSYGISLILGIHHGEANCIVFNQLEEYYAEGVDIFKKMLEQQNITLKENVTQGLSDEQLQKMVAMTLKMERPLESALGPDWRKVLTEEKILELYGRM